MLAQNFLTAKELGLKVEAHKALIKVLHALEGGAFQHTSIYSTIPNGFNMGPVWRENECGTVGCIAGWALLYMGQKWDGRVEFCGNAFMAKPAIATDQLLRLTSPGHKPRADITVDEAANALRTYLVTGRPDWTP